MFGFATEYEKEAFVRGFTDVIKEASAASTATETAAGMSLDALLRKLKPRDLAMAGVGAGSLYGANRIAQDIRMGEQIRKSQRS